MSASSTKTPGTFADDGVVGTIVWLNPGNAGANDATYATATAVLVPGISHYLKGTNCGFAIPSHAIIQGIKVRVDRKCSAPGSVADESVKLVQGGVITGNDKASAIAWPVADAYAEYGGQNDLWGLSWTPAQINAANFGAVISAAIAVGQTASIDHVEIIVYYTLPQSVTATIEHFGPGLMRYTLTWQADEAGAAELWLDGEHAPRLEGDIRRLETMPSAANAPSADYDITLEDRIGADLLGGVGADRSDTTPEPAYPYHSLGTSGHGERATIRCLKFAVANAGEGGAGVAAFYVVKA